MVNEEKSPRDQEIISQLYYKTIEWAFRIRETRCIYCGEPGSFVYDGAEVFPCCRDCYDVFHGDSYDEALIDTEAQ